VQGDHDRLAGIDLPRERIVTVRGRRIGLVHGRRSRAIEMPAAGSVFGSASTRRFSVSVLNRRCTSATQRSASMVVVSPGAGRAKMSMRGSREGVLAVTRPTQPIPRSSPAALTNVSPRMTIRMSRRWSAMSV
jgi:hypothetical protein